MAKTLPEVVLPCDLSSWRMVQEALLKFQSTNLTTIFAIDQMIKVFHMTNASIDINLNRPDPIAFFESLRDIIENQFSVHEKERFLQRTLPCMSKFAISLKELKPSNGFRYSIKHVEQTQTLDRRLVASLVANIFFSTFPLRTDHQEPSLVLDLSLPAVFSRISSSLPQALRLRNLLNYFDILDEEEPWGHLRISRIVRRPQIPTFPVVPDATIYDEGNFMNKRVLTPIFLTRETFAVDLNSKSDCSILRQLTSVQPEDGKRCIPDAIQHPEVLILYLYAEELSPHEMFKMSGLLMTSVPASAERNEQVQSVLENDENIFQVMSGTWNAQKNLFKELKSLSVCLDLKNQEMINGREESSIISSKNDQLDQLAEDLSMIRKSASQKDLDEVMQNLESSSESSSQSSRSSRKKSNFADRLKAAMERGMTPDSENLSSHRASSKLSLPRSLNKAQPSHGSSKKPPRERPKLGNLSDNDSNYSFDFLLEEMDTNIEDLLLSLVTDEDDYDNEANESSSRLRFIRLFCEDIRKRSISESHKGNAFRLDLRSFTESKPFVCNVRRANSLNILQISRTGTNPKNAFFIHPSSNLNNELKGRASNSSLRVVTCDGKMDLITFLVTWLTSSYAELELLVLQSRDVNMEEVYLVCNIIEQRKISFHDLLRTVQKYLSQNLKRFDLQDKCKEEEDEDEENVTLRFFLHELSQ